MNYHEDHEKRALNALAEDMASIPSHVVPPCSSEHRDAALGLPLVMTGSDATDRLNEMIGTTPGPKPSRKDAASLSETQARRDACRAVERWAYRALLASGLTPFQLTLLKGYHDSVYHTRIADLNVAHAREDMKKGGAK